MSERSRSRSNSPFSSSFSRSRSRSVSPVKIESAIRIPTKSNEEHSDKIIEGISPISKNDSMEEDKRQELEIPVTKLEEPVAGPKIKPVHFTRTFNYDRTERFQPLTMQRKTEYYERYNSDYYNQDLRYLSNGTTNSF